MMNFKRIERFFVLIQLEHFDYKWRKNLWKNKSVHELSKNIMSLYFLFVSGVKSVLR